jgi:hypothetical protein
VKDNSAKTADNSTALNDLTKAVFDGSGTIADLLKLVDAGGGTFVPNRGTFPTPPTSTRHPNPTPISTSTSVASAAGDTYVIFVDPNGTVLPSNDAHAAKIINGVIASGQLSNAAQQRLHQIAARR